MVGKNKTERRLRCSKGCHVSLRTGVHEDPICQNSSGTKMARPKRNLQISISGTVFCRFADCSFIVVPFSQEKYVWACGRRFFQQARWQTFPSSGHVSKPESLTSVWELTASASIWDWERVLGGPLSPCWLKDFSTRCSQEASQGLCHGVAFCFEQ